MLNSIIKKGSVLILAILAISCMYKEPNFTIKGDAALIKNIKVNVEMMRDGGTKLATAYYNGNSYTFDNTNVLRYKIYVSYQDKYFNTIEMDNLHSKIKGKSINEITIRKKGSKITVSYKGIEESSGSADKELIADKVFFEAEDIKKEKEKFTGFYK